MTLDCSRTAFKQNILMKIILLIDFLSIRNLYLAAEFEAGIRHVPRYENAAISLVSARDHGGIHAEFACPGGLVGALSGSASKHQRPRRLKSLLVELVNSSCR